MGKPKEKTAVKLPAAGEVAAALPLVDTVARAKKRLAKVREATPSSSDPKHRAARKRVKRAQRRLRRTLQHAVARAKPVTAATEAPAS